ncbi:D-2-hydroxyacid dehydrogenase [Tichowtungia aerotolerans]|uniref:D-2-hydroxyacid dehydrogenase n=1 Tax=Tichowtungia aerotolerans TaxID=2697043 RepID=A0A6P1M9M1_9BACT|nr:D-2-hydroxyacid dehydrogenase [Tichowtungia aerotolerans]QHI69763.1 D-2-hydroxyacid dehydrogenase [Tichowtungia aerotolerans]
MKIVVTDGYALNPGDLSWEGLEQLGEVTVYDRTPPELVVERLRDADAMITNKVPVSAELLGQLPNLKYIGVTATGYNIIDIEACRERGVVVSNVPAYSTAAVVQLTWAHIFNLLNQVALHADSVRCGEWSRCKDFCYWKTPQPALEQMTLGLIGFGNIGQGVAATAKAFGVKVLVSTRTQRDVPDVEFVSREALLSRSDIVSLHCPQTPETEKLINAESIALMKPGAFIINTSRGGLIDEPALAEALNSGRLAGAGLDVLSTEPPAEDNPLISAKNCFITPHIAWAGTAARKTLMNQTVANLRAFLDGEPVNRV